MKKFYNSPVVEIEKFTFDNQITTSGINEGGEVIDPGQLQTLNDVEY